MKSVTFRDLGIRWWYWLIPATFGAAGIGAFAALRIEPESRTTLTGCGMFFAAVSFLGFLWPMLRVRELAGAEFVATTSRRMPYRGTLLPISKVKLIIGVVGGAVLGVGALLAALFADSLEQRVKAGIASVVFSGFLLMFIRAALTRRMGILLTEDGIVWNEVLLATGLVPWPEVAETQVYIHRERYSNPPTLGVRFRDIEALNLSYYARRKLAENLRRWGWHCYFHAETLLIPLPVAESIIRFYKAHPDARWELATGSAVDRIARSEPGENAGARY